ncbi:MAG TPA: phosphoserine phosphatase SerB [Galbitalea sp.]|nr:phosphoserine phosphatase SerB [Galbitalea sp.]
MPRFLVVLDVDSTLIENEVIELLAEVKGTLSMVESITADAMNGLIDFESSLRSRVSTLQGLSSADLEAVGARVQITAGVPEMIRAVHAADGRVGVVSGGFHEVIDPIAEKLGLDYCRANRFEFDHDGRLTGLRGPIIDAGAKADTLREWADEMGIPLSQTVAVGDGANDLRMMAICGLAVGFDAKAPVRDLANVIIDRRDMMQLLPLMGLRG